ncbi:MAG: 1-deoxy-D-xylulose-5-phosphate synthase [Firmicutes bacterium]|nr:1-deoxy-D-xylulose-5-phosphate synthase [Candidatus Fermentithermobacillaceae bacterium]
MELRDVKSPEDIRNLSVRELESLAQEIRWVIIGTVAKTGGHLAASLGAVELTLALHSVFDTPRDKIVWDVGHQTYAHKLITGRYERFHTLRQLGGLSGFPKRAESPYDVYDTGHAAGSISYALGLAKARDLNNEDYSVVAVIGDGALTSGIAYEGLNNAGELRTPLIVVLNDNSMSISENVGGMSKYLTMLRLAPAYRSTKAAVEKMLDHMPSGSSTISWLRRFKGSLKYFLLPEAWFEALGFRYYGPVDGHDIGGLKRVLKEAKALREPVFIHVITQKGKGYSFAMEHPEKFHGPGPFDAETGELKVQDAPPTYSKVLGETLVHFAERNPKIAAITAAMADGTGLKPFKDKFPDRFFDVGIAESHAVAFAAGLAQGGMIPVVCIYSTFLQRAYDQIVEDVCLQNLKVIFAIDRAGIVGQDGETHHGQFDVSYLRHIPGLTVMAPKDERELVNMLWTALSIDGPSAIRYPRGCGVGVPIADALAEPELLDVGKSEVISCGEDINILALGSMVYPAVEASRKLAEEGISAGVVNARFVVPFDPDSVAGLLTKAPLLVLEENVGDGGFGEMVISAVAGADKEVHAVALPKQFIPHGSQDQLRSIYGLDMSGIVAQVKRLLAG